MGRPIGVVHRFRDFLKLPQPSLRFEPESLMRSKDGVMCIYSVSNGVVLKYVIVEGWRFSRVTKKCSVCYFLGSRDLRDKYCRFSAVSPAGFYSTIVLQNHYF